MNSTALGAEKENINFISEAHEKFYYEKIQKVREADVYHKALCYCIGMNEDTRGLRKLRRDLRLRKRLRVRLSALVQQNRNVTGSKGKAVM